ncbi:hypothetical protein [Formosa sp. L2A11]|uniref:hypothetical protein n=1 Tax=Formosa sp. L2A11 TaxID=2686363 RepID=UPI00131D46D7|nr:hypothetical protein [Formosa sp. L2A11]
MSCSSDDENQECLEINELYVKALEYAGGNPDAINEIKREYEEMKSKAGCN